MYTKPDFITVSVKLNDVFSSYLETGCPEDTMGGHSYTGDDCKDMYTPIYTYTAAYEGNPHQCYSTFNP